MIISCSQKPASFNCLNYPPHLPLKQTYIPLINLISDIYSTFQILQMIQYFKIKNIDYPHNEFFTLHVMLNNLNYDVEYVDSTLLEFNTNFNLTDVNQKVISAFFSSYKNGEKIIIPSDFISRFPNIFFLNFNTPGISILSDDLFALYKLNSFATYQGNYKEITIHNVNKIARTYQNLKKIIR